MDLMEIGCEDGRWMELAQDRVQWWVLVLAVLNRCVLLPESWLISKIDLTELRFKNGQLMELVQDLRNRLVLRNFSVPSTSTDQFTAAQYQCQLRQSIPIITT
jgi:hypothetical protein